MAVYTVENTSKQGQPVMVLDGDGCEIPYCVEADTESGRIVRLAKDDDGRWILNEDRTEILRREMYVKAPLCVVATHTDCAGVL